ncbi:MAG: aquaporin [Ilumatobacteraceae bacterium]
MDPSTPPPPPPPIGPSTTTLPPDPPATLPLDPPATASEPVLVPPGEGIADTRGVITTYSSIVAAEFIGTAVLVMIGPGSAILAGEQIGLLGISLAFGFALLLMAYVIGPISGCHINPAVTLGFLLTNKIRVRHALWAWGAQLFGGVFGAAVIYGIASGRDGWEREGFASNGWDRDGFSGLGAAMIVEIVFTALFVVVVLATTSKRFAPGLGGLVAGITLAAVHLVTIPVDNTSVNPARSIATALFADTDPSAIGQLWVFIIFPLIGSLVGVFIWLLLDEESRLEDTMLDTDILRTTRDAVDRAVD